MQHETVRSRLHGREWKIATTAGQRGAAKNGPIKPMTQRDVVRMACWQSYKSYILRSLSYD